MTASRVPLAPGDEAGCLLLETAGTRSRSGKRQTARGTARVRIEAVDGDVHSVVVLSASPSYYVGRRLHLGRAELHATSGEEQAAFHDLITALWGSGEEQAAAWGRHAARLAARGRRSR